MTEDDGWVSAAMDDSSMAAEVILRLKRVAVTRMPAVGLPVRWGRRMPRSRMPRCEFSVAAVESCKRKERESSSARCSPTTPLSWSGGGGAASPSTGDGGFEESTSFCHSAPRSKVVSGETTSASTKKWRKKTYAELREEESSLLTESIHLRKEITMLQATYKEQSATNENLKRLKLGLDVESKIQLSVASEEQQTSNVERCAPKEDDDDSSNYIPSIPERRSKVDRIPGDACCNVDTVSNPVFLFDLNMIPPEEEAS